MESLWPAVVPTAPVTSPLSILKEQGDILGKITNNVLEGEVVSDTDDASTDATEEILAELTKSPVERRATRESNPVFYHSLNIKVPSLGNYRYRLLYVQHAIALYPAVIGVDGKRITCANENEFKDRLRGILSSPETTRVLAALLTQARG